MKNFFTTLCLFAFSSSFMFGQIFTDNFGAYPNNASLSSTSSWQHDGVGDFTNKVNATFGAFSSTCFGQLATTGAASAYVDLPVSAGNTYVFKAYLKTTNNMIYSTIKIRSGGISGTEVGTSSGNVSSNYTWEELQTEYTPTANETVSFSIEKSQGQVLNIDKVRIICTTCPENTLVYDFQDSKEGWLSGGGSNIILGSDAMVMKANNATPVGRSGNLATPNFSSSHDYNTARITFKTPYAASGAGAGKLFFYSNAAGNVQFATFDFDRDAANTTTFQTVTVDLTSTPSAGNFNDSIARIGVRGPWGVASGDTVYIQKIELFHVMPLPPSDLVITTEVCGNAGGSEVRLTGPWWSWDPAGGPVAADNGDGTYTFTFSPVSPDDMEYLLVLDGVLEDMVAAGTASGDWSCSPITDSANYAHRQWLISEPYTFSNVYGQCEPCSTVNLNELSSNSVLKLYPNPASELIKFISPDEIESIQVVTLSGKIMKNVTVSNRTINIQALETGMYYIFANVNGQIIRVSFVKV